MRADLVVRDALTASGLSKSSLSRRSGVSRALVDDYLRGARQPSVAQLNRIVEGAGLQLQVAVQPPTPVVSAEFVAVLDFGDLFPRKEPDPLVNVGPVWRQAGMRPESEGA